MPKRRLTAAGIERLSAPRKGQIDYFDQNLPSFGLRISKSGTKSFFAITRINGRLKRFTLGRWPAIGLAEARTKAAKILEQARAGLDPSDMEERRKTAEARLRDATFDRLVDRFMDEHVDIRLRPSTAREYRRYLRGNDTEHWRGKPLATITKDDVATVIRAMRDRGSPGAAGRALAYLSKFFSWCAEHDFIETPPTLRLTAPIKTQSRDRFLSPEEISIVGRAFEAESGVFGPLFQLLLLTGQRRGEIAGLRWCEIEGRNSTLPVINIPASRTKNKHPHLVPLASQALDIVQRIPVTSDLVFSTDGKNPVSGFGKAKARIDRWIEENHGSIPHWTLHDLRRTMVTVMNEDLRIAPHVVEATVNHVSGSAKAGVAGVYNRALYLEDRHGALAAWADYVAQLQSAQPVDPPTHEPDQPVLTI